MLTKFDETFIKVYRNLSNVITFYQFLWKNTKCCQYHVNTQKHYFSARIFAVIPSYLAPLWEPNTVMTSLFLNQCLVQLHRTTAQTPSETKAQPGARWALWTEKRPQHMKIAAISWGILKYYRIPLRLCRLMFDDIIRFMSMDVRLMCRIPPMGHGPWGTLKRIVYVIYNNCKVYSAPLGTLKRRGDCFSPIASRRFDNLY